MNKLLHIWNQQTQIVKGQAFLALQNAICALCSVYNLLKRIRTLLALPNKFIDPCLLTLRSQTHRLIKHEGGKNACVLLFRNWMLDATYTVEPQSIHKSCSISQTSLLKGFSFVSAHYKPALLLSWICLMLFARLLGLSKSSGMLTSIWAHSVEYDKVSEMYPGHSHRKPTPPWKPGSTNLGIF